MKRQSYSAQKVLFDDRGMTIVELLVSSALSMLLIGMTLSVTLANRELYGTDVVRTRINQNLRGAFDIINSELRQAGERLPQGFPAIEIINGTAGNSDTLILRRNTLDQTLTVCQNVTTSGAGQIHLTNTASGAPPACTYGAQASNLTAWQAYKTSQNGLAKAYIYDFGTGRGEFFNYNSDYTNATTRVTYIHSTTSSWARVYPAGTSSVYALSEWRFELSTVSGQRDLLQLTENQNASAVKNVTYGITSASYRALMQDGTWKTSLTSTDNWTQLKGIEVTLTGQETYRGRIISSTLSARLFPRNVLSN